MNNLDTSFANTELYYDHRHKSGYTGESLGLRSSNLPQWMRHLNVCQPVQQEATGRTYSFDTTRKEFNR